MATRVKPPIVSGPFLEFPWRQAENSGSFLSVVLYKDPWGGVSVHFDAKVGPAIECRLIKVCSISGYVCCIVQSQTMLKWHLYAK